MSYLPIELARTIDEDRYREAEGHRRNLKTLATPQKQSTNPVQILVNWLSNLPKPEERRQRYPGCQVGGELAPPHT